MKAIFVSISVLLAGCASINAAMPYAGAQPQRIPASVAAMSIDELDVRRSVKRPGKVWVSPPDGKVLALAYTWRDTQWAAMLSTTVEPAYRAAALVALRETEQGSCSVTDQTPWPDQFAIEYAFSCDTLAAK